MVEAAPLRAGDPERLGRYRIHGRLGEGGQGAVYLGRDEDGALVAVKVLKPDLVADTSARRRFGGEVDLARQVSSFCIAEVLDADLGAERPYIVSEYVEGSSLAQAVAADGPRTGGALHRLAVGTVTALVAIHQAGVVHRDFKPHNVLLGPDGARVIDFGIARLTDSTVTAASGVLGSVSYMSPEQIGGETVGPASDVFSWAATVAFAATGRHLFGTDSVPSVLRRILYEPPALGGVPAALVPVLTECLDKDPLRRPAASDVLLRLLGHDPQSTDARALDVRAIAETQLRPRPDFATGPDATAAPGEQRTVPFVAPKPTGVRRSGRRRGLWIAAAAAVVVALAGGFALFLTFGSGDADSDLLGQGTAAPAKPPAATGNLLYRQSFDTRSDWDGYDYMPESDNPAEVATRGNDPGRGVYTMLARGEEGRSNAIASPYPAKDGADPALRNIAFGVTAQVQSRSKGSGEISLMCRGDEDTGTGYFFYVSREGAVRVVRQDQGAPSELLTAPAQAGKLGDAAIRLEAACREARLTLWVDGKQVVDVRDPDPLPESPRVQAGVGVRIPDAGDDVLEVSFDDFTVYRAA